MSQLPYPEDDYLRELGRLAYAVQYLEGGIYDLLQVLEISMPKGFDALEGRSTGQLAHDFAGARVAPGPRAVAIQAWVDEMALQLGRIAPLRNGVLHARPATSPDGQQRLHRRNVQRNEHFLVDGTKLEDVIQAVEEAVLATSAKRVI